MAEIKQYTGPYLPGYSLSIAGQCLIGISIGQKDFMTASTVVPSSTVVPKNFYFCLNNSIKQIQIGKTFRYQTGDYVESTNLIFPNGAPDSLKINVIYLSGDS